MNLPAITQNAIMAINPKPGQTAIETRRVMVTLPEITQALTPVEYSVFLASTKTRIKDLTPGEVAEKLKKLLRFIAIDVGYRIPDNATDWAYTQTRLFDLLQKYYNKLTLTEIKLAFELALVGELNEYLPKDGQGNPDTKHYQNFNAEYFSKILNAYIKRQNEICAKAFEALPKQLPIENKGNSDVFIKNLCRGFFFKYKYSGRFDEDMIGLKLVFDWLKEIGYIKEFVISEADEIRAFEIYKEDIVKGFENRLQSNYILKHKESTEIQLRAYIVARNKAMQKALDEMIKEEINIENYL